MYDYCIIGTGPAGITLANELSKTGKKICLIESGSKGPTKDGNNLKKVISTGEIIIKEKSRVRAWGGTSNTWAGLSAPLDKIDFEKWPIELEDLEPYYKKLDGYGFAPYEHFQIEYFDELKKKGDFVVNFQKLEEKIFLASDPAINFGKKFKNLLENERLDVLLDSTVIKINKKPDRLISSVNIINSNNQKQEIRSEIFILCAGGLESTRLLLNSNIGNESSCVGKYLMNHPKNNFGILKLNKPIKKAPYLFGYLEFGFAGYAGLRINENLQKELGVLNSYIRFEPMYPWTDSLGVYSLITLSKRAKMILNWWKNKQKDLVNLKDYNETGDDNDMVSPNTPSITKSIFNILLDPRAVFLYILNRLQSKKEVPIHKIRIRNFMEMEPREENAMTLSDELDIYGSPIPIVKLNTTDLDRRSMIELHKILKEEVDHLGLGKFESDLEHENPWPINFEASHHLGGTIMGIEKNESVVDTNLKVHSTHNLYVCGGSVFPTSGCTNPTYTICALSIRLAEHLKTNAS